MVLALFLYFWPKNTDNSFPASSITADLGKQFIHPFGSRCELSDVTHIFKNLLPIPFYWFFFSTKLLGLTAVLMFVCLEWSILGSLFTFGQRDWSCSHGRKWWWWKTHFVNSELWRELKPPVREGRMKEISTKCKSRSEKSCIWNHKKIVYS